MPPGGDQPAFEQLPKLPESGAELPDRAGGFETPAARPAERAQEPLPAPLPAAAPAVPSTKKDPVVARVEGVMEEGLADAYLSMPPALQARFKQEGERAASEIAGMIRTFKVKFRRVLGLLTNWLKLIPGVNRFFLEQEAKIKADRIVKLAEEEREKKV